MPQCTNRQCGGSNVILINPGEKIPQYRCLSCKVYFIEQKDRIKVQIAINKDFPELREIDARGVINKRCSEFWKRTFPACAPFLSAMEDEIPNIWEILTPCTTIERDARRAFEGNEQGLNRTYRNEEKPVTNAV